MRMKKDFERRTVPSKLNDTTIPGHSSQLKQSAKRIAPRNGMQSMRESKTTILLSEVSKGKNSVYLHQLH